MKLYIHCGLHKTGSTALQTALIQMSGPLRDRGVSFPSFDADDTFAHHWLAGALKGPHAFKGSQDKITAMIDVAKSSNPHTVCFSSEDFETHLRHRNAMSRLSKIAARLDATPVFVLYLRNQVEYLESLYLQFLRMGLRLDATDVIDEVIETGQFKWRKWVIQFDYAAVIASLTDAGFDVIVRSYHQLENGCIIQDFLSCIDQPKELKPAADSARPNAARLKRNLQRFVNNRESDLDASVVAGVDKQIEGLRPRLSTAASDRMRSRFWDGNSALEDRFDIALNHRFDRAKSPDPVPVIDCIFATEAVDYLAAMGGDASDPKVAANDVELPANWLARV